MVRITVGRVAVAALALIAGACSDSGPSLPILFVQSAGGNGSGTVTSAPAGINCTVAGTGIAGTCSANFDEGAEVTLTASPTAGSAFSAWDGGCTGSTSPCSVTLAQSTDVTAAFALQVPRTLEITSGGTAEGVVNSSPAGINCTISGATVSGACSAEFADGTVVTLVAAGVGASVFTTWEADCAASGADPSCQVTMSADRSVVATFGASTTFTSLVAVATGGEPENGLLVVSIPSSVFLKRPSIHSRATFAAAELPATGTLQIFGGGGTVDLSGTYDDVSNTLAVEGGGWNLSATISEVGDTLSGSFGGPLGGGLLSGVPSGTSDPPTAFCGTFDGGDQGSWNLLLSGTEFRGTVNSSIRTHTITGSLSGTAIRLDIPAGGFSADGTLAADGQSASGTWGDSEGFGGTWQVSTPCE